MISSQRLNRAIQCILDGLRKLKKKDLKKFYSGVNIRDEDIKSVERKENSWRKKK